MSAEDPTKAPGDGSVYSAFITRELAELRATKDSLERRAAGVLTSAGGLITVVLALTAFGAGKRDLHVPHAARLPIYVALGAFLVAAVLAVIVGMPFRLRAAKVVDLERIRRDRWQDPDWIARRRVAGTDLVVMASYKTSNKWKARFLLAAVAAEVAAVVALAVAAITLIHGTKT